MEQIFQFEQQSVRIILKDDDTPWFVATDVCAVLGIQNSRDAMERLDEDELMSVKATSGGQNRDMTVINESGLYTLIMRSRKAAAKRFRKWVTAEVLPSIRRTGQYSVANGPPHDVCLLQAAVERAAAHEAACLRIALHQLAKREGITSVEEFQQLAKESLENGDANPNPELWNVAPPHPETVRRITARMVDSLARRQINS